MKPLTLAAGKRGKWIVLLFWVAVAFAVFPFASKLTGVEKNDAVSYLPGSAESTKALNLDAQFPSGQTTPAVIVYHRDSGLTPADQAKIAADRDAIVAMHLPNALDPSPLIPSQDGREVIFSVPFQGTTWDGIADAVQRMRDQVSNGNNGMDARVTGGAGFAADFSSSFQNLNGRLLIATVSIVTLLLLITYRSPFLWLLPLIAVGVADQLAQAVIYGAARAGLTVNGQSAGILTVLAFGAGTDYALLLVARYREELRRHEDRHEAMRVALRRAGPAILASAATVTISLLCLLIAQLNSNRGLGPVCAIGIVLTLFAMLTLLPALLVIFGRGVFWPFVPRYGSAPHEQSGFWSRVGRAIACRPRAVWVLTAVVLGVMALGIFDIRTGLPQTESFRTKPDSVLGQELLAQSFPSGASQPEMVVVQPAANVDAARAAAQGVPNVASLGQTERGSGDLARFAVTLSVPPGSQQAFDTIDRLRQATKAAAGPGTLVGGGDAVDLDVNRASVHDRNLIIPVVLAVVFLILGLLLRSLVAPLLLIATVIVSFLASLGVSSVVFDKVFGFAGQDISLPFLAFIFLVALGIDYNIFLMARVREESMDSGTRRGMLTGLAVTGGVITSAGLVLAGTFSVLGTLPLVTFAEIGFVVAFGVLLDTLIVRSVLVPALTLDLGSRMWWPSRLARRRTQRAVPDRELVLR
jgi:RND superfamily putative drug exporter